MIRCDEVTKTFRKNGAEVVSLDRFTAEIAEGEFVAVRGPSGSGKTTLLLTLGGMQRPSAGAVQFGGRDLYGLPPAERARLRSGEIGFVFQMFHLVPYLDLLGNVLLAAPGRPSDAE
ncbi:MAG: ATP-binding cassette domain-containing protein, partial [Verrucomicrobiota bacterium]|nr:ATP-binding cassette domain-containing protein [Verrucomicrobiota bacterium]